MSENKKNIEEFYSDSKIRFPKIIAWNRYSFRVADGENSVIMSELAEEIILWTSNNQIEDSQNFFDYLELCLEVYDESVTAYIYTDFLLTIMETKEKETRALIKKMMRPKTKELYLRLFLFYREPD